MRALRCLDSTSFFMTEAIVPSRSKNSLGASAMVVVVSWSQSTGESPASTRSRFPGASFLLIARVRGKSCSKNPDVPHIDSRRVSPSFLNFGEGYGFSGDVTVQDGLVSRVAALHDDVVHLFWKRGVAKQQENEVIDVLQVVRYRHSNN